LRFGYIREEDPVYGPCMGKLRPLGLG